jgi:hypothetical protein
MQDQVNATAEPKRVPWNKGKLTGAKPPLRPKHVWSIRTKLQIEGRARDLAMFNLTIDSKLRGCDVVAIRVEDVAAGGYPIKHAAPCPVTDCGCEWQSAQEGHVGLCMECGWAPEDWQESERKKRPTDPRAGNELFRNIYFRSDKPLVRDMLQGSPGSICFKANPHHPIRPITRPQSPAVALSYSWPRGSW